MKLNTVKLGLLALGIFGFSLTTSAQEKKAPDFDKMFKRFDTDKNETISLEEFKAYKRKNEVAADALEKRFARMDADQNGAITLDELKANFNKPKAKKPKKKPKKKQE